MFYLQATYTVALVLATVAILVAVTRVVRDEWRGREADGRHLAVVMLGREMRRQAQRGEGEDVDPVLNQRLTALQVEERPATDRPHLGLRFAPVFFVGAFLLHWVVEALSGQSASLWARAGDAWLATAAGICVAYLLHVRRAGPGRSEGAAAAFVALLAVLSALV